MAFFEFNIALTGLFASQRGLQVTSNNITNANTTGYSRQEVKQKASRPLSGIGVGMTGTGVDITGLNRVRDSYIDQKLWSQNPRLGEYNIKVTQNSMIESAFGEPSEKGFTAVFNELFNSISNVGTNPSSKENKVVVQKQMETFAKYYNNISGTLSNYQENLNFDLKSTVNEINSLSTRLASLNEQIMNAEIYGDEASSFRDERDNCLDRLSQLINIEVEETEYELKGNTISKMRVKAAGQVLVDHVNGNTLELTVRDKKLYESDVEGLYDIKWSNGLSFDMYDVNMSGELKAIIDLRDGCGTGTSDSYCGIPYYIKRIDGYVQQFAKTMNEEYSRTKDGYIEIKNCSINNAAYMQRDSNGKISFYDASKSVIATNIEEKDCSYSTKYALFTCTTGNKTGVPKSADELTDYSDITAANFSISKELYDDPTKMRTVYEYDSNGKEVNPSDTSFILNILAQKDNKDMFREGDPKDYMVAIFSELGINAKEAGMYQNTQKSVVNNLTNQRMSVSQVDISEEFTYLIKYQQAYQASAKMMTTIDEIYNTTIFKLGNF